MTKFKKFAATAAILSVLVPGLALASNGNAQKLKINWVKRNMAVNGTVTAVNSSGFELKKADGGTYSVLTASSTITNILGLSLKLSDIKVNDKAQVKGHSNGNQISATKIVITPANTHRAEGGGKITAINGNNVTVQQNHGGIVYNFTMQTNASTTITGKNNSAATLSVGSNIKANGLWDEVQNVLLAIKVKIK